MGELPEDGVGSVTVPEGGQDVLDERMADHVNAHRLADCAGLTAS
jgi:hypothetical protein